MVTMYTTSWCGYCVRLKTLMQREGIEYAEVNIEEDESAAEIVITANRGNRTVPTLVFADGEAPALAAGKAETSRKAKKSPADQGSLF